MKEIRLETVARGYRQQMSAAMRGDIKNGLIELITNADDAYMKRIEPSFTGEPIRIFLDDLDPEAFDFDFQGDIHLVASVVDEAGGIEPLRMEEKLTKYGDATSNLVEGGISRGIFGRGAKDVSIFGYASFQTIRDGEYFELTFSPEGGGASDEIGQANEARRQALSLPDGVSGFKASIIVNSENAKTVPSFGLLVKSLQDEAQLRFILQTRYVTLEDRRSGRGKAVQLSPTHEVGDLILEETYQLPEFAESIRLKVFKLSQEQEGEASSTSNHGMLVHSGRVAFENSWFGMRQQSGAEWLRAELDLPGALKVIENDNKVGLASGSLVDPGRRGLNQKHPYFSAALAAATPDLLTVMRKVSSEKQSEKGESDKLRQANKVASEAVGKILKQFFEDLDDEPVGLGDEKIISEFDVIPPLIRVPLNSKKTLSLRADAKLTDLPLNVVMEDGGFGGKALEAQFGPGIKLEWQDHPRLKKRIGQWRFESLGEEGVFLVTFSLGDQVARCQIVVSNIDEEEEPNPESMQFEKAKVQASLNRGKRLVLVAPIELVGSTVRLASQGLELTEIPEQVIFGSSASGSRAEVAFRIATGPKEGSTLVVATNEETGDQAQVEVIVAMDTSLRGFMPNFRVSAAENPRRRAVFRMVDGIWTSTIFARHQSFNGVFGDLAGEKFENESSDDVRSTIAITHAEQVAGFMTEREAEARPGYDVARILTSFFSYQENLAGILGRIYLEKND